MLHFIMLSINLINSMYFLCVRCCLPRVMSKCQIGSEILYDFIYVIIYKIIYIMYIHKYEMYIGSCQPHAISKCLIGSEILYDCLRANCAREIMDHREWYATRLDQGEG